MQNEVSAMWGRRIAYTIIVLLSTAILAVTGYLGIILFGTYTLDETELIPAETTTVVDQEGNELVRLFEENRETVSIEEIPEHVQHAFIAVEDQRFFEHTGLDFRSIGRALYRDIVTRSAAEGGSTITQQLAKNAFLSPEKSLLRKTEEALIALNLEHRYEKEEILEMYLNRIYFGHGAHGVQAASRLYFDKSIDELEPHEGALLAALPKGPALYSPFADMDQARERRNLVLGLMHRQDYLTAEETVSMQSRTLPEEQHSIASDPAYDTFVDMLLREMETRYGISEEGVLTGGYTITTSLDADLQADLYERLTDDDRYPEQGMQGAGVLLDNETGAVTAVQGGKEYTRKGFNYAASAQQPGSLMKPPAVYAPAMESGDYEPYSLLTDELLSYDGYEPRNFSDTYSGEVTMYEAVKDSLNAPAVWLLNEIGIEQARQVLADFNIESGDEGLSIALGGMQEGISPLQAAAVYRSFADGGMYTEPYLITNAVGRDGEDLEGEQVEEKRVFSEQTAWYMTRMLEAAVTDGTASAGDYSGDLAGKTGTSQNARDIWFAGWTPELSGALWMGGGSNGESSSGTAASLFKEVIGEHAVETAFEKPDNVTELDEPIQLAGTGPLEVDMRAGFLGAEIELSWQEPEDDRVVFHVYRIEDGERELLEEIEGGSSYTLSRQNLFSSHAFQVVPYNPQTRSEGEASDIVEASWNIFSRNGS
nr:PBP1A family penicillin-binding protein [Alkalicoccus luteus]